MSDVVTEPPRTLVIACGALVNELIAVLELNGLDTFDIECLPAKYHMTPTKITPEIITRVERARATYDHIYVGYADCGTGGDLDAYLAAEGIERLPGAHCYEFFAGAERFAALHDAEPGTFYLTDYLVKNFDRVVWAGLGMDRYPQLINDYFGNYTRLIYLSQLDPAPAELLTAAEAIAVRLDLRFEHLPTGYGTFESSLLEIRKVEINTPTSKENS